MDDVQFETKLLKEMVARLDPDERPEEFLRRVNLIGGAVASLRAAAKRLIGAGEAAKA